MFQRIKLWWLTAPDELESELWEMEQEYRRQVARRYAGNCPTCGAGLIVSINQRFVNRTCPTCAYSDKARIEESSTK